ncbi:hypothetical protein ACJIZ3_008820 [Penstemon smallii]|uniref:GDSL esterase/lipase At5g03610-like n=1 Tax=Penstemon smallii TaxID=265156 RepID=A0ABD3TAV3_9LAMI
MGKKTCFIFLCLLCLALFSTVNGLKGQRFDAKLFVFGDSYVDTGNSPRSIAKAWKPPYGITYPGKPSGRFSDGRVLTDYIASFLRIRSPMPYVLNNFNPTFIRYGINFAHGGTGVFPTLDASNQPNMTTQIDFFQQLISKNVYIKENLRSSVALVSLAGNDYATYLAKNGTIESHNELLLENLLSLNKESSAPVFIYLDLYKAFSSALKLQQFPSGNQLLKPCCAGVDGEDCGFVDTNGIRKYVLCRNLRQSFFWDLLHPTNEGWRAVYFALRPSLKNLL